MKTKLKNNESLVPGTDYIIAASENGIGIIPAAESSAEAIIIGGFHTLCADVGEIPGHSLSGYHAGDILPSSIWNQKHRARCLNNSGLVYDVNTDLWVGIYLASEDGSILNLSLNDFVSRGEKIGQRLLTHEEFSSAADGSNELTNIKGSSRPKRTGGNVDSSGRRMISNIGLEDCCGAFWQWLSSVDPANDDYQLLAGGGWGYGAYCGSRSRLAYSSRWSTFSSLGARCASEPLNKRVAETR